LLDGVLVRRVVDEEDTLQTGNQLPEDLQPFRCELDVQRSDSREIATRARQALHQSQFHGIAPTNEDDGDAIGRHLSGFRGIAALGRHDNVSTAPNEVESGRQKLGALALREAHADREVLVLAVPEGLQSVPQPDDRWRRAPGFRERADLDQAGGPLGLGPAADQPVDREDARECQKTEATSHHGTPGRGAGTGSASSA
jgi:hypothetical protein